MLKIKYVKRTQILKCLIRLNLFHVPWPNIQFLQQPDLGRVKVWSQWVWCTSSTTYSLFHVLPEIKQRLKWNIKWSIVSILELIYVIFLYMHIFFYSYGIYFYLIFFKRQIFILQHTENTICNVRWSTGLVSLHPPGKDCAKAPDTASTQQTRLNKPMVF